MAEQEVTQIPIPKVFYSFADKKPFEHCISCERKLLDANTEYLIEKAIRKYPEYTAIDVIFEYAICIHCANDMRQALSQDSQKNIQAYFDQHVNLLTRRELLLEAHGNDVDKWLDTCIIKKTPLSDLEEYQIYGHFLGENMLFSVMPYMISGAALNDMTELLSAKTKGEMDDFIDQHFGLPPELKKLLKEGDVILI